MAAVNLVIRAFSPPLPQLDRVDIYFHSRDMRFQILGKSQYVNCKFCAPLTKIMMSQTCRENSHLWTEIDKTDNRNLSSQF